MSDHQGPDHQGPDQQVVIIGAGISGASTAFALARRGVGVTIVDDGSTGQATAAGAGIIQPWATATEGVFYELYATGAAFYPELLERLADAGVTRTDFRRTGGLVVNADPEKLAATRDLVLARAASDPAVGEVAELDHAQAKALFPPLADGLAAIHISGGGRVDGRTLRDALLQAAVTLGARRESGRAVLEHDGTAPVLTVAGARLPADAVVAAAGAWSNELLAGIGYRVPIAPQKGQITQLRLEGVDTSRWPTVHPISHHYLVPFDDSRIAVGATRETGSGFDTRVTAAGQLQVLQDALSVAPGLADATLIETRVGLRPLADDLPVVGEIPDRPGIYLSSGYGAAGLTMSPRLGDVLARKIIGEAVPEIDPLAPARSGGDG